MTSPTILWDWGTAYDLFVSLGVLHKPADFGVRGAWAAGVRARLPAAERETLEQSQLLGHIPFQWIFALPEPKDTTAVLWALGQMPPAERLPSLALCPEWPPDDVAALLRGVAARGAWDASDREALGAAYRRAYQDHGDKERPSSQDLVDTLTLWARVEEFGERYVQALRTYHEVFFAEEERRISPLLQNALSRAQELAERLPLLDLLEELSQGLRFDEPPGAPELVLVPSFWCTPLMYFGRVSADREIRLFGARPSDASLVPGQVVPDALLRALKALSDPTRLRILHYLSEEPLAPAELARRLRLRAPTVTHHLQTLRLAGLVQVTLRHGHKDVKRYAVRSEAVTAAFESLQGFLDRGQRLDADAG
jgi:DNA-binding transcriptional ArsR family regulator